MQSALFSRLSLTFALVAALGAATAYAATGGAIFSPGALHAGDSASVTLGGVRSHAEVSCSGCHAAPLSARPMAARCEQCHTDIQREFADTTSLHGAFAGGRECMSCHTEHRGADGTITSVDGLGEAHEKFGFSLEAHVTTDAKAPFTCRDCHEERSFKFEPARCESCHREYQDPFVTKHVAEWGSDCQSCHDGRDRFSDGRFSHDTTGFRLDGAHVRTDCVGCHVDTRTLAAFADAPTTCIGCHRADDEHRGGFGTDCASCHTTTTWEGATFDHEVFPLDHGRRGPSKCSTCHLDETDYKQYTCYGCHEHTPANVIRQHRGEVNRTNLDDCVECHAGGREHGEEGEGRGRRGERERGDDHGALVVSALRRRTDGGPGPAAVLRLR